MLAKFTAWVKGLRDDALIAKYHAATPDATTMPHDPNLIPNDRLSLDIFWHNDDGQEVAKRVAIPRIAVGSAVQQMLATEVIEVGDVIYFRGHK